MHAQTGDDGGNAFVHDGATQEDFRFVQGFVGLNLDLHGPSSLDESIGRDARGEGPRVSEMHGGGTEMHPLTIL